MVGQVFSLRSLNLLSWSDKLRIMKKRSKTTDSRGERRGRWAAGAALYQLAADSGD